MVFPARKPCREVLEIAQFQPVGLAPLAQIRNRSVPLLKGFGKTVEPLLSTLIDRLAQQHLRLKQGLTAFTLFGALIDLQLPIRLPKGPQRSVGTPRSSQDPRNSGPGNFQRREVSQFLSQ